MQRAIARRRERGNLVGDDLEEAAGLAVLRAERAGDDGGARDGLGLLGRGADPAGDDDVALAVQAAQDGLVIGLARDRPGHGAAAPPVGTACRS